MCISQPIAHGRTVASALGSKPNETGTREDLDVRSAVLTHVSIQPTKALQHQTVAANLASNSHPNEHSLPANYRLRTLVCREQYAVARSKVGTLMYIQGPSVAPL